MSSAADPVNQNQSTSNNNSATRRRRPRRKPQPSQDANGNVGSLLKPFSTLGPLIANLWI